MKKLVCFIIIFVLFGLSISFAEYNSTSNGFNKPIFSTDFKFEAKLDWNTVYMYWDEYNKDEKFKYYKIVRSIKNSNPVYPDDWYIKYLSNTSDTEYKDYKVPYGTSYYRVCAITYEKNRYCSNVVKIYFEKKEIPKVCTMEYVPVCWYKDWKYKTYSNKCTLESDNAYKKYYWKCKSENEYNKNTDWNKSINNYWLSSTKKNKYQKLISTFILKLEKKWYDNEKNIETIDLIIKKLNELEVKKPKLSSILNYLIELLKVKKEKYEDDFSEIEDIFNLN